MIVEQIVRGNEVDFTTTFTDENDAGVEPATVELSISYLDEDGDRATLTVGMDGASDGTFAYLWDSSDAKAGRVYWAIRTTDPLSAEEGYFDLVANRANPDPP